jgi:hypothetical protein
MVQAGFDLPPLCGGQLFDQRQRVRVVLDRLAMGVHLHNVIACEHAVFDGTREFSSPLEMHRELRCHHLQ